MTQDRNPRARAVVPRSAGDTGIIPYSRARQDPHSRRIVELHEGTIEAEFPPDGGSRFVLSLLTDLAEVKRRWTGRPSEDNGESAGH